MLTKTQKRFIEDNPNLNSAVISRFLGIDINKVAKPRVKGGFRHKGVGIPFLFFHKSIAQYAVDSKGQRIYNGKLDIAIKVVDHLIWCIESGQFDKPRIEHPYFENLSLGE